MSSVQTPTPLPMALMIEDWIISDNLKKSQEQQKRDRLLTRLMPQNQSLNLVLSANLHRDLLPCAQVRRRTGYQ